MTARLQQAFTEISKLPPKEQDALANWLLAELKSERQWDKRFAKSQDALSQLAAEALAEHRKGETQELDPDQQEPVGAGSPRPHSRGVQCV